MLQAMPLPAVLAVGPVSSGIYYVDATGFMSRSKLSRYGTHRVSTARTPRRVVNHPHALTPRILSVPSGLRSQCLDGAPEIVTGLAG